MIVSGHLSLVESIESGLIETDERLSEIKEILDYLDPDTSRIDIPD